MCKVVEDMVNEAEARGVIRAGKIHNLTTEQIVENLLAVCHITRAEAEKCLWEYEMLAWRQDGVEEHRCVKN